jgi:ferrous iron transport protein A
MANSFPLPLGTSAASVEETHPRVDSRHPHSAPPLTLSAIAIGAPALVVELGLEEELCAWLRAVGIREGEHVTVLRRAVFGGPIHVRTSVGGEFALNRQLAKAIVLRPAASRDPAVDDDEESAA